jgi:hypothetical protein
LDDGSWQGGTIAEIIAADARNATPIAAVAYAMVSKRDVVLVAGPANEILEPNFNLAYLLHRH